MLREWKYSENWKQNGLVFGFALQMCKELVRIVIVLWMVMACQSPVYLEISSRANYFTV